MSRAWQRYSPRYCSGKHSATSIAEWLNSLPDVQDWIQAKANKKPFSSDTVRDMLQNEVYVGKVPYATTEYKRDGDVPNQIALVKLSVDVFLV